MSTLIDSQPRKVFDSTQFILIDNDFLGLIYENRELLESISTIANGKKIYIYPFVEFEFLRDVFLPKIRELKEDFIKSSIFGHIKEEKHLKVFSKIFKNALLLSKIYAHKGKSKGVSFVDLMLASFLVLLKGKAVLMTGNKKDFPSCVFDVLSILNYEEDSGGVRAISIVGFNQKKFDICYKELSRLEI